MTTVLACAISFIVGAIAGVGGTWAVFEPLARIRRLEQQVDELLERRDRS